ncbi:ABC transporter ATP-binding protein [Stutzerimonas xanthomarina]|uniref:ABC transporter ATP-binding protein n=1 Tax=Stutzerimonas xanthomarina TaxID=271420 RepID=UPI00190A52ED|nr:ABC transporter ATP-binding protein [Stutzerimonas xanthomarina]MBK3845177.1 ATP-binding cassette domain-containing protein [Stutzerimonas xanthomarina]MBK3846386.1 ATP-binding cassette domain-containing protein [Stutzerimonas xanthomarina]
MSAAVEFQGVSHTYRAKGKQVQAVRDVSFSLAEGEVFGFVGPNGAGKSTTIKIMLDIINDYQGQVTLYGIDARRAEARQGMAYVPEAPALYDQFTPLEILRMGLSMYGIKRSDADAWCLQWLERFSVDGTGKRRMRELSKGNAQRVALAHAMAVEPRLLILDEPLSGLDPVGRKDVVEILNEYKKQGGAIFFTSHVLHDVERIADRFGFINKGQLVTVRSPRELAAERADCFILRYQADQSLTPACVALRPGEFECELAQSELPAAIAQLGNVGGHLLTVKPAVSLETVFFRILAEAS